MQVALYLPVCASLGSAVVCTVERGGCSGPKKGVPVCVKALQDMKMGRCGLSHADITLQRWGLQHLHVTRCAPLPPALSRFEGSCRRREGLAESSKHLKQHLKRLLPSVVVHLQDARECLKQHCRPYLVTLLQVFSTSQAKQDIDVVFSMGLFDDVNIIPQPTELDSNNVDLMLHMTERKSAGFTCGGGISSQVHSHVPPITLRPASCS